VIGLVAYLPGCMGWHTVTTTEPLGRSAGEQRLRLTVRGGERLELRKATIVGDSVIGESGRSSQRTRTAVALRDIQQVDNRRLSAGNSIAAVVGIGAVAVGVGLVVVAASLESSLQCMPFGCP